MTNGKYKSIKALLSRLLINPMMNGINETDVAMYVGDAIRLIEAPMAYDTYVEEIEICNHRGELPCNIVYIQQCQLAMNAKLPAQPGSTYTAHGGAWSPMRYATDHFQTSLHDDSSNDLRQKRIHFSELDYDNTYSVQHDFIYTSVREGVVRMSYKGIAIDAEGFPMIPDNVKVEKAIENHIKCEYYRILWEMGKIADKVFQKVEQERDWYIGAANTGLQLQTIDQAESMKAQMTRTILKPLQQHNGFRNLGTQEYINKGSI
jgi:hypothetical protein